MKNNKKIDLSDVGESDSTEPSSAETTPSSFHSDTPVAVRWIINLSGGMIENEKQADYVLIGFTILITIVSLFFVFNIFKESPGQQPYNPNPKENVETF